MAEFSHSVDIDAPPDAVWRVMSDLENWPRWAPPFHSITPSSDAPPAVGARYRVDVEGGPPDNWEITRWEPGRGFSWVTRPFPLSQVYGEHWIEPAGAGSHVTLGVRIEGPFAALVGLIVNRVSRANVPREGDGLKRYVEEMARSSP